MDWGVGTFNVVESKSSHLRKTLRTKKLGRSYNSSKRKEKHRYYKRRCLRSRPWGEVLRSLCYWGF
jgi:hypothetical protein